MENEIEATIVWSAEEAQLTIEDLARAADVHPAQIEAFVEYGLIERAGDQFAAAAVERVRAIARLRHDLGVNLAGIAAILEMRDRMEALQRELDRLRRRFGLEA